MTTPASGTPGAAAAATAAAANTATPAEAAAAAAAAGGATTPATPAAPAKPATDPALGDADPLKADINSLLAKARKDEKDKMHSRVERAEAEAAALRAQLQTQTEALKGINEKLSTTPATPPAKPAEGAPAPADAIEKAVAAAAETVLKRAETEIFGPQIKALEAQLAQTTAALQQKELSEYRNGLLEANKDAIIPELVTGTNREELDAALIRAKQSFASIAEALKQKFTAGATGLPPVPTPTAGASQQVPGSGGVPAVNGMSLKEFSARRSELLASAAAAARAAINQNQ
jgi:hypothetical protein